MNIIGSFLFAFLMVVRLVQALRQTGFNLPVILLAMQSGMAACLMIYRRPTLNEARLPIQILAWLSAIVPLVLRTSSNATTGWLSVPGLLIMLWALWSLGTSFSIAPAARKLVVRGPYRFIRHPMYAGEIFSLVGFCLGSFSLWNWIVLSVFVFSIYARISQEEAVLKRYSVYKYFVKWRIAPGVW